MNAANRLAEIVSALERLGIPYLVMGGHAARYYGVERNTIDFDLHIALDEWDQLDKILGRDEFLASCGLREGASWRPRSFRRFVTGKLPDGREEWLEFWRKNHLLAPFPEMYARREQGSYGGRAIAFLSLPDLIRSKETERESDWRDIEILEEILDARNLARTQDEIGVLHVLSFLRSRRGFEAAMAAGYLARSDVVAQAKSQAQHPVSVAYLTPFLPAAHTAATEAGMIGEILSGPLCKVSPGSARHLALVEAVRRLYKRAAMAADRADKLHAI